MTIILHYQNLTKVLAETLRFRNINLDFAEETMASSPNGAGKDDVFSWFLSEQP